MNVRRPRRILILLWALAAGSTSARAAEPLTVERIMARDFVGTAPEAPYWADDGRSIYYSKRRVGTDIKELHQVDLASGRDSVVAGAAKAAADFPGVYSLDRRTKAWVRDGDLFATSPAHPRPRQLTRTADEETNPLVLTDGRVAFRRGNAFFAVDLADGRVDTLADFRFERDLDEIPEPETFLEQQPARLFPSAAERRARKRERLAAEQTERETDPARSPRPVYFDENRGLEAAWLSPNGKFVVVAIGPKREVGAPDPVGASGGKWEGMPVFVSDSGYVETKKVRPKVGSGKPESPAIYWVETATGKRSEIDLSNLPGRRDDPLAELKARAEAARKAKAPNGSDSPPVAHADAAPAGPADRPLRLDQVAFSDDGARVALQAVSIDNKDRWIVTIDRAGGEVAPLYRWTDLGWQGWRFDDFGWTRDGRAVWYLSEESGYSHLYVQPLEGPRRALTHGAFEVDRPLLSRDGKTFFVSANREDPGVYEAYRVPVAGGELERLTSAYGMTYAVPSLDETQLLLTSSSPTRPPELFVQAATPGARRRQLTDSIRPEFAAVDWAAPEIVRIPSRHFDGSIQARVYRPGGDPPPGGAPAVVFIHGAGYLQNAHSGWSSYYREFMFHSLLVERGFVVLDLDYRASAGYGRDYRTAIYRRMGDPELEDLEDSVAWIAEHRGVDRTRVGVYGGSYGGFLTLMALFRKPGLFAAGAALRPVTDWAHYNHSYTSAILNTPEVDPEAYLRSSPIEYAAGLARPLLICHGMVDDNVTFQDSVRLVERLIELGKTDLFETAIYPIEPHGFTEPASWTDEYKRILRLFERTLAPVTNPPATGGVTEERRYPTA